MKYLFIFLLFILPYAVFAAESVQSLGGKVITFTNNVLLPFLFAVALVIFIYNVIRYFIVEIGNFDAKKNARRYAIYSIIAFVLMVSVWGIVNLIVNGFGFGRETAVCPDSVPAWECEVTNPAGPF